MKTKSLFLVALLSLLSFSAFAGVGTVTVDINYSSTDSTYTQGDTIFFTATCATPASITETLTLRLINPSWGVTDASIVIAAPVAASIDTFLVVPANALLKDCPNDGNNPFSLMLQVGEDAAWNDGPTQIVVVKADGQDCPATVTKMTDLFEVEMNIYSGDDTTTLGMANWILWGTNPKAGDILHVTGTYDSVVGDTAHATQVYLSFSYNYATDDGTPTGTPTGKPGWNASHTLQHFVYASTAKGNLDGIIDMKVVIPHYLNPLFYATAGEDLAEYSELAQVRVVYDKKITMEDQKGTMVYDTPYQNWWGPLNKYTGETTPTLGANVSGITAAVVRDTSVELSWDLNADAQWDVIVAPKGDVRNPASDTTFITTGGINTVIAGLEPSTEYEAFVRAVADPDTLRRSVGEYNSIEFTTLAEGETPPPPASLYDVAVSENVKMFPNPTSGRLTISAEEVYNLDVLDLSGRLVKSSFMTSTSQELDVTSLKNGIYMIRFSNADKSFAKTFIKQ